MGQIKSESLKLWNLWYCISESGTSTTDLLRHSWWATMQPRLFHLLTARHFLKSYDQSEQDCICNQIQHQNKDVKLFSACFACHVPLQRWQASLLRLSLQRMKKAETLHIPLLHYLKTIWSPRRIETLSYPTIEQYKSTSVLEFPNITSQ